MTANQEVVAMLVSSGINPSAIARYTQDIPETIDSLETIGFYWAQKIASLNVNISEHADVCIFLRDSASRLLWADLFRRRVIPLIIHYNMLSNEVTYG